MSKRLQVLVPDNEMEQIQEAAASNNLSVGEWVRRALKKEREQAPTRSIEEKLKALRAMARLNLPTCDIKQMNAEIEQGYLSGPFPE
jgi:hypothetical protein